MELTFGGRGRGRGNKNLVGGGVYWGANFISEGRGMSKFLGTPPTPTPASRENPARRQLISRDKINCR